VTTEKRAAEFTLPLRELAAFTLVGVNAVWLFLALVDLLAGPTVIGSDVFSTDIPFDRRAVFLFDSFAGLVPILLPLVAVLITTHITPVAAHSRVVTLIALIEYGVSGLFGVICLFAAFAGLVSETDGTAVRAGIETFLRGLAMLALLGVAGLVVLRVFIGMFTAPRPVPVAYAPAGYPPYGQPGYPGYGPPQPYPGYGPGVYGSSTAPPPPYAQPAPFAPPPPVPFTQPPPPGFGQPPGYVPPPTSAYGEPASPSYGQPMPSAFGQTVSPPSGQAGPSFESGTEPAPAPSEPAAEPPTPAAAEDNVSTQVIRPGADEPPTESHRPG
jgi:hypothetical protein